MRFPLTLLAPLSWSLVALLAVCAPATVSAQEPTPVDGEYVLTLGPTTFVETDTDLFVDISVSVDAVNDDSGAGYRPALLCLSVALSYVGATASDADVWLASGSSTVDRVSVLSLAVEVDAQGGGSSLFRGLVIAGDDLVEPTEFFDLQVGGSGRVAVGHACPPPVFPLRLPVHSHSFTISDDDSGDEPPVEGEYLLTFAPTTLVETDTTLFVNITVDANAVNADSGGRYADGLLCYSVRVSYVGTTASDADVWLASGSSTADRVSVLSLVVELDAQGGGSGLLRGLVVAGDNIVEPTEFFDLEVGDPARVPLGQVCGAPTPSLPLPVRSHQFTISDDDSHPLPITSGPALTLLESDDDYVAVVSVTLPEPSDGVTCLPYVVSFVGGTASELDLVLVTAVDDFTPRGSGWFLFRDRTVVGLTENLLVVGDDLVEGDETLVLRFFAAQRLESNFGHCEPAGLPIFEQDVLIVDDDAPAGISGVAVDSVVAGLVFEGDPGDGLVPVHVTVTFTTVVRAPVVLLYGSLERGTASDRDVVFIDEGRLTVSPGVFAARVLVAHIIPDDLPEGNETFLAWVQVQGFPSTRTDVEIVIGNDDLAGDDLLTVRLVGLGGLEIPEGDPVRHRGLDPSSPCLTDWHCIPIELGLTDRVSEDVTYELNIVAGTAHPHEDYVPLERVRLVHHEGHLRTYDLSAPLRLEVRRDFIVESPETFYLVVHQVIAGGDTPLLSWLEQITIVDDDGLIIDDGSALWFGTGADSFTCPSPSSRLFPLREPSPVAEIGFHRLTLVMRQAGAGGAEGGASIVCSSADVGKPVDYHYELQSDSGLVGSDVALVGSTGGDTIRFLNGVATLDVFVFSDALLEPAETLILQLSSGAAPAVSYTIVVADYETTHELAAGQLASAARYGRFLATEAADALADRFSCAASAACAAAGYQNDSPLWPARPALSSGPAILSRLLSGVAAAGLVSGSFQPPLSDSAGIGGASPLLRSASFGAPAPAPLQPFRVLGSALDGARFQGDPGRWLGSRRFSGGPSGPPVWSFWGRTGYTEGLDRGATGRSLRTSMLSFTAGLDRTVGLLRLGWLQSYVLGVDEVALHESARPFAADLPERSTSWRMMGPYVGVVPSPRLRFWASPLWISGAPKGALDLDASSLSMTALVGGASVSLVRSLPLVVDLEGDFFTVAVGSAGLPAALDLDLPDASAHRRRIALRFGIPLGDPQLGSSRVTLRVARRWDSGTDLDWVWGGVRPYADWVGAGLVSATDVLADYHYRRNQSSLAVSITAGLQFEGEEPLYPPASGKHTVSSLSRRLRVGAALSWGNSGNGVGWLASVRPAFGRPSLGLPAWWDTVSFGRSATLPSVPLLDGEVGYVFRDRSRLMVSAQRVFGASYGSSSDPGRGRALLAALLRFVRSW